MSFPYRYMNALALPLLEIMLTFTAWLMVLHAHFSEDHSVDSRLYLLYARAEEVFDNCCCKGHKRARDGDGKRSCRWLGRCIGRCPQECPRSGRVYLSESVFDVAYLIMSSRFLMNDYSDSDRSWFGDQPIAGWLFLPDFSITFSNFKILSFLQWEKTDDKVAIAGLGVAGLVALWAAAGLINVRIWTSVLFAAPQTRSKCQSCSCATLGYFRLLAIFLLFASSSYLFENGRPILFC